MKAVTLLLAAAAFGAHANNDEHESHGAHEHGHGQLNLVVTDDQVMLELQAPAANLVGFEHAAKSDEEKAQYAKAVAQLKQPDALFRFTPAAGCTLTEQAPQADQKEHEHENSADKHDDEANHSDIGATYIYTCATPAKLNGIEVTLFDVYPSLEKLSVQGILPAGQTAADLTPSANKLSW